MTVAQSDPSIEPKEGGGPPPSAARTDDPLARLVRQRWIDGGAELAKDRRHYWQNLAFYLGEQWVWWDSTRNQLQALPLTYMQIAPGRTRATINRVAGNVVSVLARLTASNLDFQVPPTDTSDDIRQAARLAEHVLKVVHDEGDWETIRVEEMFAAIMGGSSAVAVEWDPSAGDVLEVDARGKIVGTGAEKLHALNVTEFCIEPGVRRATDARWWIMGLALSPRQAQARYGLDWLPRADATGMLSPLQHKILNDVGRPNGGALTLVLTMYERPNPGCPKGRYVVVINDKTIQDVEWPFPFRDELNLHVFRQRIIDAKWRGVTYMNDALPVQFHYNNTMTVQIEHARLTANLRIMAPFGSFDESDFTNEAGSVLFYSADGSGSQPGYMQPPQLPRWIVQLGDNLKAELDDIMHVHATTRGEASFDRASGQALAFLAEKDDTPLGTMAREQARRWACIAEQVLELHEAKARSPREGVIKQRGNLPLKVRWTGRDLQGQTEVVVPLESTEPHSKAADRQYAQQLWDAQIIRDPTLYLKIARIDPDEVLEIADADAARAIRENARMLAGEVVFVEGFDDHGKHIAEHNIARKSERYEFLAKDVKEILDLHIKMHETQQAEEYGQQVARAKLDPGFAKLPQGGAPIGSMIPPDWATRQATGGMADPQAMAYMQASGAQMPQQPGGMMPNPGMSPQANPAAPPMDQPPGMPMPGQ